MENLKAQLCLLADLQEEDIKIERLKTRLIEIPSEITVKKESLAQITAETEEKKKEFVNLNGLKKEKEAVLDAKEKLVAKHSVDLNSVKSNDAYKAMLLEIEKAKADSSVIEDEILHLMERIDVEAENIKTYDASLKDAVQNINSQISALEAESKTIESDINALETVRVEASKKVDSNLLGQYERIREGRNGQGMSAIDGESCGACGMVLRPQLINQTLKFTEIVTCDNCSRILYKKN
ncbi:MAG: C4-type zinc ribbon domain-containing protein [Elusimicrobia bacterium]|nr:C4-type zinc ribbon domain-containing protein [Elusimicrobiota bacterium]